MPKFPSFTPQEIMKILMKNGFFVDRIKGSHYILFNVSSKKRVVIPMHKKDLPKGTLMEIIKQSGLDIDEFL